LHGKERGQKEEKRKGKEKKREENSVLISVNKFIFVTV